MGHLKSSKFQLSVQFKILKISTKSFNFEILKIFIKSLNSKIYKISACVTSDLTNVLQTNELHKSTSTKFFLSILGTIFEIYQSREW